MDASVTQNSTFRIFVDPSGSPLRIFVEDLINGSNFVNQLKIHGARITPTAQNAQYIITDSNSLVHGSHYERDLETQILDCSWIGKCIAARRPLLKDDNWGGCVITNGAPQASTDQDDEASDDTQYKLPPRLMRRSDPRPVPLRTPNIPPALHLNAIAGAVSVPPPSHTSSNTPNSSRGNTAEPAFVALSQQTGQHTQPYVPQTTPTLSFQTPVLMQNGAMITQPFPMSQQFLLALEDVYRNTFMNYAAFSQNQQPQQQPYPIPPNNTVLEPPASTPASSIETEDTMSNGSSFVDSSRPSSTKASRNGKGKQKASSSSRSPSSTRSFSEPQRPIFTRNGESIVFFVQVDISQRHDLVNQIKKNGGTISNEQSRADFAILSSRSKTFATLFRTAIATNTPAIMSTFVHDCIRKGRMLSHDPKYLVEGPRKLGSTASDNTRPSKKPRVEVTVKDKVTQDHRANLQQTKSEVKVTRKEKPSQANASSEKQEVAHDIANKIREQTIAKKQSSLVINGPFESERQIPSPPPPPENTRVLSSAGRFSYSSLEREYVETYVKVLFGRDHLTSNTQIAQKLHKKMPHHSLNSWNTMVGGQLRDTIEKARKRAGIAFRKNAYDQEKQGQQQSTSEGGSRSVKSQKLSEKDPKEQDIRFIAQFFADGEANGMDDEDETRAALWERLHQRGKWRTPRSWEDFYEENHLAVKRYFSELTGQEPE